MANRFQVLVAASFIIVLLGVGAFLTASMVGQKATGTFKLGAPPPDSGLVLATCTGALAETPDLEFSIPLDKCDTTIDAIEVKSGFLSKWTICGGAKSFEIELWPRAVKVTSDAFHCSSSRSEVSVTFIGSVKK